MAPGFPQGIDSFEICKPVFQTLKKSGKYRFGVEKVVNSVFVSFKTVTS